MTKQQKINKLVRALRFYKNRGTKLLMVDTKTNKLFIENGIIADEVLVDVGANKKRTKKMQYL